MQTTQLTTVITVVMLLQRSLTLLYSNRNSNCEPQFKINSCRNVNQTRQEKYHITLYSFRPKG